MLTVLLTILASCGAGLADGTSEPSHLALKGLDVLEASGPRGGPFAPSTSSYVLLNTGSEPLQWNVVANQTWLQFSSDRGELQPDESTTVTASISNGALALPAGLHEATVYFAVSTAWVEATTRDLRLTVEDDGWTEFVESPDTRKVFVSSSLGQDSNDGLRETTPRRTLAAAKSLLRDQFPDWLLLRSGDVWNESLGNWTTRGRSIAERQLISSYGTGPRPLISSGSSNGLTFIGEIRSDYLAIVNLHFRGREGALNSSPHGLRFYSSGDGLLIEGCYIERYFNGLTVERYSTPNPFTNTKIRRCIISNNYAVDSAHSQGAYFSEVDGLLLEQNIFYQNGWSGTAPNATPPNIFRHNIYIQTNCANVTTRENYTLDAAATGLSQRVDGIATGNVSLRNPIGLAVFNGSIIDVSDNLIMEGRDIDPANPRGWGIVAHSAASINISQNLIIGNGQAGFPIAIQVEASAAPAAAGSVFILDNTVFNWDQSLRIQGPGGQLADLQVFGNDIQSLLGDTRLIVHTNATQLPQVTAAANNRIYSSSPSKTLVEVANSPTTLASWRSQVGDTTSAITKINYTDSARSVATYHGHLGRAPSYEAFVAELLRQSKGNWRAEYEAPEFIQWVRAGFEPN